MRQKLQASLPEQVFAVRNWESHYLLPGVLLTASLAGIALYLRNTSGLIGLSPLIIAIVLGMLLRNLFDIPTLYQPGILFSLKRLLRFAIALLGLQLSLSQLQQVGLTGFGIVTVVVLLTFSFTCWMGRRLKLNPQLTYLIAMGTSICGASAIVATTSVLDGSDEDTTYAVATISLFGTVSMLLYPVLMPLLHLSPAAFGIWCGTSIHEVAQTIAAAFQASPISGELASITKLSRVLWLVPLVLALGMGVRRNNVTVSTPRNYPAIPWFILAFVGLILLNSTGLISEAFRTAIGQANQFLLAAAMAAMGLETRFRAIWSMGLKPMYLGAVSWLFITLISLGLVSLAY